MTRIHGTPTSMWRFQTASLSARARLLLEFLEREHLL